MILATFFRALERWALTEYWPLSDPAYVVVGSIGVAGQQNIDALRVDAIVAITVRGIVRSARMNYADARAAEMLAGRHTPSLSSNPS